MELSVAKHVLDVGNCPPDHVSVCALRPVAWVELQSVWVRGNLGAMSVRVTREQGLRENFSKGHEAWDVVHESTLGASPHVLRRRTSPTTL